MIFNTPLVTIVLPVYNGAQYLSESIKSCLNQTYQNIELIIVDDCSTDNTPEIIYEYLKKDTRVKSICHKENRKLPAALNTGFKMAIGEYFTWTSDDNLYHPAAIEEMLIFMQKNPEVNVVYTDYSIIDEKGLIIKNQIVEEPDILKYRSCISACFMYQSKVYKCLKGFDEGLFLVEDYDFWLRAFRYFTLKPLHKNLYFYRRHSKSLTDQYNEKIFLLTRKVMARYEAIDFHINIDDIKQRPVFIWGTGNGGKYTFKVLQKAGIEVNGFIDSNPVKWSKQYFNLPISSPEDIEKVKFQITPFIFIGSTFIDEIERKLEELGYKKGKDFTINIFANSI